MKNALVSILVGLACVALACLSASHAHAAPSSELVKSTFESLPSCGNFARFDDSNVYTGFGPYWTSSVQPRQPKPGKVWVTGLLDKVRTEIATLDSAIDLFSDGATAYVLTYSGIEVWDLATKSRLKVVATTTQTYLGDEEHAQAFARRGDKIIVAHGRLGVSFLDLKTGAVRNSFRLDHAGGLESMAKGVSVSGKYAYVVLDSYSLVGEREKPAFRGVIVIDMETEKIVSDLDGMDPGADSVVADGDRVIVSFYGQPLWKYSATSLLASSLPQPLKRVWKFPVDGHGQGKASVDAKYYYTCFARLPLPGEGSSYKRVPMVLDRAALGLD